MLKRRGNLITLSPVKIIALQIEERPRYPNRKNVLNEVGVEVKRQTPVERIDGKCAEGREEAGDGYKR